MSKEQLIEAIRRHNPTAGQTFLGHFNENALNQYLSHLQHLQAPRNVGHAWIRAGESAAAVTRKYA